MQEHNGYVDAYPVPGSSPSEEWAVSGRFQPGGQEGGLGACSSWTMSHLFEQRKLWLPLNASHSLLACRRQALVRGYMEIDLTRPIASILAFAGTRVRIPGPGRGEAGNLPLPPAEVTACRKKLPTRFSNPAMRIGDSAVRTDRLRRFNEVDGAAPSPTIRAELEPWGPDPASAVSQRSRRGYCTYVVWVPRSKTQEPRSPSRRPTRVTC